MAGSSSGHVATIPYKVTLANDSTGLTIIELYPGSTTNANFNAFASNVLPRVWRVTVTHSAGTSFTYSVSAAAIL